MTIEMAAAVDPAEGYQWFLHSYESGCILYIKRPGMILEGLDAFLRSASKGSD